MRHIDYGLGVLHAAALTRVPDGQASDLATLYQELLAAGELAAFESPHRFYEIEIGSFPGIEELSYVSEPAVRLGFCGRLPGMRFPPMSWTKP
jgi:hypothetical protein